MSDSPAKNRLERLVTTGICSTADAEKLTAELVALATKTDIEAAEKQSKLFKALSDPTRLRILRLLETRELCVCEVMVALDILQPAASYHLRLLEGAGLIKGNKQGRWVFYKLANPKLVKSLRELELL
jgi:ArsR family transcriptional regulator